MRAIDIDGRAVHVVRFVGRQPYRGACHIFRLADALGGNQLEQHAVEDFGRSELLHVHGRPYGAGRYGVDADFQVRHFLRQALHEEHDAALGRGIVGMPFPGDDVVHRAHEDELAHGVGDGAVDTLPLEDANRLARAQKHTREVDVDHPLPLGERHLVDLGVELDARVGRADVHTAEDLDHVAEHGGHLVFLSRIRLEEFGPGAACLDAPGRLPGALLIAIVVDQNIGSGLSKAYRPWPGRALCWPPSPGPSVL